jgi:hypothetical protein
VFADGTLELTSPHLDDLVAPEAMQLNELVLTDASVSEERLRFRSAKGQQKRAPAPAPATTQSAAEATCDGTSESSSE